MSKIKLLIYIILTLQLSSCSVLITEEGYGAILGNPDSHKNYSECKEGQRFNCYKRF